MRLLAPGRFESYEVGSTRQIGAVEGVLVVARVLRGPLNHEGAPFHRLGRPLERHGAPPGTGLQGPEGLRRVDGVEEVANLARRSHRPLRLLVLCTAHRGVSPSAQEKHAGKQNAVEQVSHQMSGLGTHPQQAKGTIERAFMHES